MKGQTYIIFLAVPESIRDLGDQEFSVNPDIPIPVEVTDDAVSDLQNLSWEMIIAGMMQVIIDDPATEHADYYRRFIVTVRPNIISELSDAALIKARNNDCDAALKIIDDLQTVFPDFPQLFLNRALVLEERAGHAGQKTGVAIDQACAAYDEALAHNPMLPVAFFYAGFFFMKHKRFGRAKECFLSYLACSDDPAEKEKVESIIHHISQNGLDDIDFQEAYSFISAGALDQGLEHIHCFLERYPDVWNAWFMLGWALRKARRYNDARKAFEKALELGGNNSDTRNELAICLMELGDFADARAELLIALRKDSENVKIISNLGALSLKMGRTDEAEAFFRTVLAFEPDDTIAASYLQKIER
ncbi:MAG: tetratricopeptide repeat protein [Spirochaetaceae bacterium]|jgi:tetratricopeptide (TPR) repeat protein|nr:tetratricopeptide repeat protein [Spirochaetaceae bacterium]